MKELEFLKPAPGRLVRDPITGQPLPETGALVNLRDPRRKAYFRRRLKDGDVIQGRAASPRPKEDKE